MHPVKQSTEIHIAPPHSVYIATKWMQMSPSMLPLVCCLQLSKWEREILCNCTLLSSAARINYVGMWCPCWVSESRERSEALTYQRSFSAFHSGWEQCAVRLEALGGRPKHCMEKTVEQLRVHHSDSCYTQTQRERERERELAALK